MSTDYPVYSNELPHGTGVSLCVVEQSSKFDVTLYIKHVGALDIANNLDVEQLAEVGLKFLQAALYNCRDVDEFRAWLHTRVNEVDHAGQRTPCPAGAK